MAAPRATTAEILREAAARNSQVTIGAWRAPRGAVVAALRTALAILLFGSWELASGTLLDPFWVSSPTAIVAKLALWTGGGSIFVHAWMTLYVITAGLAIGLLPGVALGVALGASPFLNRLFAPFLVFFYCIPLIALAPLLILWFGLGLTPKIVIVAVIVLFLVFFNVHAGMLTQDRDLSDGLRLMGGRRRDIALKIFVPASLPWIAAGVRIAVPYAVVGAVVGEMIVASEGLGFLVKKSASVLDSTGVFAGIVVLTAISVVIDSGVHGLERRLLKWSPQLGSGTG